METQIFSLLPSDYIRLHAPVRRYMETEPLNILQSLKGPWRA